MTTIASTLKKASFGTDTPSAIRNLFLTGICTALAAYVVYLTIPKTILYWFLLIDFILTSAALIGTALWMVYSSWIFKPLHLDNLIRELELKGNEAILDIGCGRGLFLCAAAKKITTGRVYGIDLWISKDQSNNSENATRNNAEALGIQDRIDLQTADMCDIPYADDKFDVIISNLAIHNIASREGRELALQELLRTLKPNGTFIISDILKVKQYAKFFESQENVKFEISTPYYQACPPVTVIRGKKTK